MITKTALMFCWERGVEMSEITEPKDATLQTKYDSARFEEKKLRTLLRDVRDFLEECAPEKALAIILGAYDPTGMPHDTHEDVLNYRHRKRMEGWKARLKKHCSDCAGDCMNCGIMPVSIEIEEVLKDGQNKQS